MSSINAVLDALDAAVEALAAVDSDVPDPVRRYRVLERLETAQRRLIAVSRDHIARLQATVAAHRAGRWPEKLAEAELALEAVHARDGPRLAELLRRAREDAAPRLSAFLLLDAALGATI